MKKEELYEETIENQKKRIEFLERKAERLLDDLLDKAEDRTFFIGSYTNLEVHRDHHDGEDPYALIGVNWKLGDEIERVGVVEEIETHTSWLPSGVSKTFVNYIIKNPDGEYQRIREKMLPR
jgi:hypothetical protein